MLAEGGIVLNGHLLDSFEFVLEFNQRAILKLVESYLAHADLIAQNHVRALNRQLAILHPFHKLADRLAPGVEEVQVLRHVLLLLNEGAHNAGELADLVLFKCGDVLLTGLESLVAFRQLVVQLSLNVLVVCLLALQSRDGLLLRFEPPPHFHLLKAEVFFQSLDVLRDQLAPVEVLSQLAALFLAQLAAELHVFEPLVLAGVELNVLAGQLDDRLHHLPGQLSDHCLLLLVGHQLLDLAHRLRAHFSSSRPRL